MRLIDVDELKELFAETITYIARKTNRVGALEHMIRASAMVIQMIDDAPTVDAVAVIRCRNCIHFKPFVENDGMWCDMLEIDLGENGFCSYGREKNNGISDN